MVNSTIAPFGSWRSPITSDLIVADTVRLGQIAIDGPDVYWVESRPWEGGRSVIVRRTPDGKAHDVNPAPFNARTRVHEYGGGAYLVADGHVYFSNFADQRVHHQFGDSVPQPLTSDSNVRFADYSLDRQRNRLVCVREDHRAGGHEPENTIVSVSLDGDESGHVLVSGNDFFSSPRLSPDGSRLAWLAWNHPNMPWDGCDLWVGDLTSDGQLSRSERVAGGVEESIFQPEWSPDGHLYFVSDRTGWWNLYCWRESRVEHLVEMAAEFGWPQWVFGMASYGFESAERLICSYVDRGTWRLASMDTTSKKLDQIEIPYTEIREVRVADGKVILNVASPAEPASIAQLDLANGDIDVLRRSSTVRIDPGYLSPPRAIEFPTENGVNAHAFYYPPNNRDFDAPFDEKPPLLVKSHGGPTSSTSTAFNLVIQYWTSRGIAVLDVNYGGSTGYGRAYWQRLRGQWGIVDVDDCANGARYLVERGDVDGNRLAISGGSAGGYTTLCALTFRDVFRAGASHYGVSDLQALATETHKFESRYLDSLVGPYPARRDLYHERSPIRHTDRLACPVIFLQGTEDKIVPPNQAEMMVDALRAKGVPVAFLLFEGEQHGFRRAETIKRAVDAELYFYSRIFGFELADSVEPVHIENL